MINTAMDQWLNGHVVGHSTIPKVGDVEHDGKLLTRLVCEEHVRPFLSLSG